MTHDELHALPEANGFGMEEFEKDGKLYRRIVRVGPQGALWAEDDEACMVVDADGVSWMTGWLDGVRYRSRMRG